MTVREPIPARLNLLLAVLAGSAALALLWLASHTHSWPVRIGCALAFSYVNNTLFSLLHECVHGIFHPNRAVNEWAGRFLGAFFPTGLAFQRICHLGHHQRNRSEHEQWDYLRPHDNKFLKYIQWYGILTGVYWLLPPAACLLYLVWPGLFRSRAFAGEGGKQSGAEAMTAGFQHAPETRIRLETLLVCGLWRFLVPALDLSLLGLACCYTAFAINWSSLQYADHAWSELHVTEGAWNLRVHPLIQKLFLNYHHHKAHHQYPKVSWLYLDRYVDPQEERPRFLSIYLEMWKGPKELPR